MIKKIGKLMVVHAATTERKPLSKQMRFRVFKRDAFTCMYCGGVPPSVTLEIDHITPVSAGGSNELDNLITACFSCNRGKAAEPLDVVPQTISQKSDVLAEREAQIRAYNRIVKQKRKREDAIIDAVEAVFEGAHAGLCFKERFRETIRHSFMQYLGEEVLIYAMHISCGKAFRDPERTLKYFCGCCWNRIRSENDAR